MATRVRTYRINVDANARKGDAIVIDDNGGMTSQHLGTAASADMGICPGNIPVLNECGTLSNSIMPSNAMKKNVYDPNNKSTNVFDYCNLDNTPEIPVVNDPIVTFKQGGVTRGSITLNQAGATEIELMAGGLEAGKGIDIYENKIEVDYDACSLCINNNSKLEVIDYATIASGAAAGATAVQPEDLCSVAISGEYCDLTGTPTIPTDNCQLSNGCGYITNAVSDLTNYYLKCETYKKCEVDNLIANFGGFEVVITLPTTNIKTNVIYLLGPIGTGPDKYEEWIYYNNTWTKIGETTTDLSNYAKCCDIPTDNCQLSNGCGYTTCTGTLVASDLEPYAKSCDLCAVATSGLYCDLTGSPTLCAIATSAKYCDLIDTPSFCTVATSGLYCDLTGTPTIPAALSAGNGISITSNCINVQYDDSTIKKNSGNCLYVDFSGYTKSCDLCAVATSGKYCDLTGTPTIPTDNCELNNGCGYITGIDCSDVTTALGFTPYDSTNPSGYTTCTGTLDSGDLVTVNGCSLVGSGDICIQSGTWGQIDGTLCDQTDLQCVLDGKLDKVTSTGADRAYIVNASGEQTTYNVAQGTSNGAIVRRTGTQIVVPETPTESCHAASKCYVDAHVGSQWGCITGTLCDQTDLQGALDCKQDKATSGSTAPSSTPTYIGQQYVDTANDKLYVATGTSSCSDWNEVGAGTGDMSYADYCWVSKSGASIALDLNSTITPSADFTVNIPSEIKEGQAYVLRVNNSSTAYTMTLGSCITNPSGADLTLTPSATDQFIFLATNSTGLELQSEGLMENNFVTQTEYNNLPSSKTTNGRTYFIYE